jgi:signal transduction histidine kinase
MADTTDFLQALQTYVDRQKQALEECLETDCMNELDFPVVARDSLGMITYWNKSAMTLEIPNESTTIWATNGNYYVMHQRLHYIGLIPIKLASESEQSLLLCQKLGDRFEYVKFQVIDSLQGNHLSISDFVHQIEFRQVLGRGYLIAYFLAVILLFLLVLRFSKTLIKTFGDWQGSIIVILLLTCIRLLFSIPTFTRQLAHHDIFQHQLNSSVLSPSLGELFLNMLLFFIIAIFLFKTFDNRPVRSYNKYARWYFLISGYLLVMLSIISFVYVAKRVVIHSTISFQFDKIYVLDWNTHVFILSILLFISALFFLSYLLIKILGSTGAKLGERLLAFFIATLLTYPIFINLSLHISAFGFYILVLSILILMDLFVETRQKSISWLVIWLVTIASGTTALLYAHNSVAYYQKADKLAREIGVLSQSQDALLIRKINNKDDFDWAIFDGYDLERQYGQPPVNTINTGQIPSIGQSTKIKSDDNQVIVYRQSPGTLVMVSNSQNVVIQFISLFSFLFTSLALVIILVFVLNLFLNFLPIGWNVKIEKERSIRRRIQYVIFSMLILSFATVFAVTSYYLRDYESVEKTGLKDSHQIRLKLFTELLKNNYSTILNTNSFENWESMGWQYSVYTTEGQSIHPGSSQYFVRPPYQLTSLTTSAIKDGLLTINQSNRSSVFQRVSIDKTPFIIGITETQQQHSENYFINNLLGTLLNLYIFLFVIASSIALTFSDTITRPLFKLREKFSSVTIGRSNERIDWQSDDELGQLISDYNNMIEKIEESVNTLAMTEREVAWREMAKQVAHEIKNPLTPMKLSLQHLQMAIKRDPDRAEEMIDRVGKTLLEQIDNLSHIASEFSNFGKMPTPENKQVVLNDVASSVHDLFRKREDMDINLYIPIDEIYVFGDHHYMRRVLINLLKNAIQAIPTDRRGQIQIHVYKDDENAVIKVKDNGMGIPLEIRDKVFQPNFTSKNSGTGLGLAICANIVESFNGKIYFETEVNVGTTFFIEIPLMHMADNFKKDKHVIL